MKSMRQIVPEWKSFLPQLQQTVKDKEASWHDDEEEDAIVYLDALPTQQHRYSCVPNYLQCLNAHTGHNGVMMVGFQWGHTMLTHRMEVWTENVPGILSHSLSLPLESGYRVEHLIAVPVQRVFVGACDDLSLRVFADPFQGMGVQFRANSLGSVLCMHFCKETGQLLTASIGMIAFWGFWTTLEIPLGLMRVLDWHSTSLSRDTSINGLITESQTSSLYVLCDCSIKSFHNTGRKEYRSFRGSGQGTLRSVSADWIQRYLYTGDNTGCVQVWNRDSSSLLQEFRAHSGSVSTVLLRPNTRTLLTSSLDGWVKEWNGSGDLLLKLFLDDPGGVKSLQLVDEHSVLCHCARSFTLWRLQSLYRQFSQWGQGMQRLQRVEVGRGRARLLGVSLDSIVRVISPVSGELLLLSWPLLFLDHALGFAYNPSRKELFVAGGTDEVLILDMTLSPSPAKRILRTSRDPYQEDSVTCLETVLLAGPEWAGEEPPRCLLFSGHHNGKLQLLSPHGLHCPPKKAHGGVILQMSSFPGPRPSLCCYGSDGRLTVWELDVGETSVEIKALANIWCSSPLVLTRLLSNLVFGVSENYNLLFFSLPSGSLQRVERNPATSISCLDYCSSLGLLAFSGPNGTVEIWESRCAQLAEIHLAASVSQLCFANARADLLVCFSGSISIIPGLHYLPLRLLRCLLHSSPVDDVMEEATPFLPRPQSSYGMAKVPRLFLRPGQGTPERVKSPRVESVLREVGERPETGSGGSVQEALPKDVKIKTRPHTPPLDGEDLPGFQLKKVLGAFAVPLVTLPEQEPIHVEAEPTEEPGGEGGDHALSPDVPRPVLMSRPVARDGFLPNSVLRNWPLCYLQSNSLLGSQDLLKLKTQRRSLSLGPGDHEDHPGRLKVRGQFKLSVWHWQDYVPPENSDSEEEEEGEEEEEDDDASILETVVGYGWLKRKPKKKRKDVLKALMETMATMDGDVYEQCSQALQLLTRQGTNVSTETMRLLTQGFLQQIQRDNPVWKRLRALRNMDQLNLLGEKDLAMIAEMLLDKAPAVRQMAKFLLQQVLGIHNKTNLLERLHLLESEGHGHSDDAEFGMQGDSNIQKIIRKLDEKLSKDMLFSKPTDPFKTERSSKQGENGETDRHWNTLDKSSKEEYGVSRGERGSAAYQSSDRFEKPVVKPDKQHHRVSTAIAEDDSTLEAKEEEAYFDPTIMELYRKSKTAKQNVLTATHPPSAKSGQKKAHLTRLPTKAVDQSDPHSPPDKSTASIQTDESAGRSQPAQSAAHIQPGQSTANTQPGQSAGYIQPEAALTKPNQSVPQIRTIQSAAQTKTDQSVDQTKTGQSTAQTKTSQSAAQTKTCKPAAQTKTGQSAGVSQPGPSADNNQPSQSIDDTQSGKSAAQTKTGQPTLGSRPDDKLQSLSSEDLSLSLFPSDSGIGSLSKETTSVRLPPLTWGTQLSNQMYLEPIRKAAPGGCQTDTTSWKDHLYKLISLNGFRCPRNARLAAMGRLAVSSTTPAPQSLPCYLPRVRTPTGEELSVGQRVVRKIQVRASCLETSGSSQFHHGVPLPWQLNSHTLDSSGESQYGRLKVDWIRGSSMATRRRNGKRLQLPPIKRGR